jgi:hypothetical protein
MGVQLAQNAPARPEQANYPPRQTRHWRSGSGAQGLLRHRPRDRIWTADITYVHTQEGFLKLAFILDAYSRKE